MTLWRVAVLGSDEAWVGRSNLEAVPSTTTAVYSSESALTNVRPGMKLALCDGSAALNRISSTMSLATAMSLEKLTY